MSIRLKDCRSIEDYFNKVTTTHQLKEVDFDINEEMIAALLLSGLPNEYKSIIMAIENSGILRSLPTQLK